jgi:hypothetical protein
LGLRHNGHSSAKLDGEHGPPERALIDPAEMISNANGR